MDRKGWRTIEVPDGWLQTEATGGALADGATWRWAPEGTSTSSPSQGSSRKEFPTIPTRRFRVRGRVGKLEVAISALGEDDPAVTGLEALRQARLEAQVRPVDDRIKATKMFIERARKREEITKAQAAVLEAQAKLTKKEAGFRKRVGRIEGLCSHTPSREDDLSGGGCQAERGRSSKECQVPRSAVARPDDGRQFRTIAFGVGDQVWPQSIQCDGDPHRPSRFECQVEPSIQSDVAEWHRSMSAKYGLRGIRAGEVSHPGVMHLS